VPASYSGNNISGYNAGNPATYNPQNPASYSGNTAATYNAGSVATYNPPILGTPGTATNVLGVYFPGGAGASANYNAAPGSTIAGYNAGQLAPYVPETPVDTNVYPDSANYPVTVPSGGQIVVKIE
jgi:hypothetical protein